MSKNLEVPLQCKETLWEPQAVLRREKGATPSLGLIKSPHTLSCLCKISPVTPACDFLERPQTLRELEPLLSLHPRHRQHLQHCRY